jgi:competence protein ComFC
MNIRKTVAGFFRLLLDLAFPEDCLLCGIELVPGRRGAAPVCPECVGRLAPLAGERCAVCGLPLISEEKTCTRCRERRFAFDRHRSLFEYRGDVRELLFYYKFKACSRLGELFAGFIARERADAELGVVVVPVPSRRRTVRKRGFAAVELLARRFARRARLPYAPCLARGEGLPQKTLDYEARLANLAGQITVLPVAADLSGRSVLLVDDIFTTGATAHECAAALKKAGASEVTVLTVAMET